MNFKGYFKGWYFKCCTGCKTVAFIPAYHYGKDAKTASLQIITDDAVFSIPFKTPEYTEKPLFVRLGDCVFSDKGISLNYQNDKLKLILGTSFTGVIGAVLLDGREYRIATYLGASVKSISGNTVTVRQGGFELTAELLENRSRPLFAPINGNMSRTIHESASCKAYYCFSHNSKPLCEFTSDRASFEFEYA